MALSIIGQLTGAAKEICEGLIDKPDELEKDKAFDELMALLDKGSLKIRDPNSPWLSNGTFTSCVWMPQRREASFDTYPPKRGCSPGCHVPPVGVQHVVQACVPHFAQSLCLPVLSDFVLGLVVWCLNDQRSVRPCGLSKLCLS